jgi:hypothetical protein
LPSPCDGPFGQARGNLSQKAQGIRESKALDATSKKYKLGDKEDKNEKNGD